MTRRITIALTVMAIVVLAGLLMTPVSLVGVEGPNDERIVCRRVTDASSIALTFTHSMYGGDVTETYRPGAGNTLLRTSILAGKAAAAEYYAWDGAVREVDGQFEVIVPDEEFASLAIRVNPIGNHRLAVDDATYDLTGMVDGSSQVRLSIVSRPLVTQLFGSRC